MHDITRFPTLLSFALVTAVVVWAPTAAAATITVTSITDDAADTTTCSLRDAVAAANTDTAVDTCVAGVGADVVHVALAGTIALTQGQLSVTDDVAIEGMGRAITIIDAGGLSRIFNVAAGSQLDVAHVSLQNGMSPGSGSGGVNVSGTLNALDVLFRNNTTLANGGAITGNPGSIITVDRCSFQENYANSNGGGAIYTEGPLDVSGSDFYANSARLYGGAIHVRATAAVITTSSFRSNAAQVGGALFDGLSATTTIAVSNTTFFDNHVASNGAGVYCASGTASFDHATFVDNGGFGSGAAFHATGTVTLRNSMVIGSGDSLCVGTITADNNILDVNPNCTLVGPTTRS